MRRVFALTLLVLGACGGAAQPASPASDRAKEPDATPSAASPETGGATMTAPTNTAPTAAPSGAGATTPTAQVPKPQTELDRAESAVQASMGDCQNACRALRSMENAADGICRLDGGGADCASARQRVTDARERVRRACGACQGR